MALQRQSGEVNIASVMGPWTTQSGYPVVFVQRNGPNNLTITQERFFLKERTGNDVQLWEIPLSYASSQQRNLFESTAAQLYLRTKSQTVTVAELDAWVVFNVQQTGEWLIGGRDWHPTRKALDIGTLRLVCAIYQLNNDSVNTTSHVEPIYMCVL